MSNRMDEIAELQRQRHKLLKRLAKASKLSKEFFSIACELQDVQIKIESI